jgi:hypothetical protein
MSPSRQTRMRRPDAIHSSPRPHNTFDALARAETRRHKLKRSDRVDGHIQVRNTFWFFVLDAQLATCTACGPLSVSGVVWPSFWYGRVQCPHCHRLDVSTYLSSFACETAKSLGLTECVDWGTLRVQKSPLEHVLDGSDTSRVALRLVVDGWLGRDRLREQSSRPKRYLHDTSNRPAASAPAPLQRTRQSSKEDCRAP